ncbi:legumain-like [Lycorma delicatula]|uniref:legumain-like n=1 Tax=Lycorma delicatula TaxID=130591 RepID=UPI003F5149F3
MRFLLILLISTIAASYAVNSKEREEEIEGDNKQTSAQWALLVAGSSGWWNYRHQADISHAYHILLNRGIPASNIIVMMYDDVAHDSHNPQPGKLINKPDGPDVYGGVKIDYKGSDVTPKNFLNILSGNKSALTGIGTGRVIESGSKDNVFVNFADHGGTGVLCFPSDHLSASELFKTLESLTAKKKYGKLVLYIEACEAGSMFDNLLPQNTKILASTASAADESSWGWYCDYKNYPCLGDLYSINWMEHLDSKIPPKENLFDQYQKIRTLTKKSHVNLYGDYKIGPNNVKNFIGPKSSSFDDSENTSLKNNREDDSGVPSRDVALQWIKRMAENAPSEEERKKYKQMADDIENKRKLVDTTVHQILKKVTGKDDDLLHSLEYDHLYLKLEMLECYEQIYRTFSKQCFNLNKNQYILRHFYKFANICLLGSSNYQAKTVAAINEICNHDFPAIIGTL